MMIECILGACSIAAFMWTREGKESEQHIKNLQELRDKISMCGRRIECYASHRQAIGRDLQSLQGKIPQNDKLFDMLKILQREWKDVQNRYRIHEEKQNNLANENTNAYFI